MSREGTRIGTVATLLSAALLAATRGCLALGFALRALLPGALDRRAPDAGC